MLTTACLNLGFHSLGFLAGRLLVALVLVSYTEIMHRKNFSYLRIWIFLFFLLLIPSGQNIFASIASATKPLLAQKPASGAEEQIQPVFVWDETTKTLYSCRVQRQIFQNCTLGIPFDPSGYYDFVNSEPMFTDSGYAYGPNPFFSEASNQIGALNKAQSHLKNSLQNKMNSSGFDQLSKQKQLLLSGFLDKLNSRDPAYVKPSSYIENSGKHGHHNCLTGNITFHTNESNIDELKYFLTHESMHNFDSFSGKNKYGLLRELNETYVEKDGAIADLYKSGMMQPDNADSAASWILYYLKRP